MEVRIREALYLQVEGQPDTGVASSSTLVLMPDGTAYRRVFSGESDEFIDVHIPAEAVDYEHRLLKARKRMYAADQSRKMKGEVA